MSLVVWLGVEAKEPLEGLLDVLLEATLGLGVEDVTELAAAPLVLIEVVSVVLDKSLDKVTVVVMVVVSSDDMTPESNELVPSLASSDVVDGMVDVVLSTLEEPIRLLNKVSNED